MALTATLTLGIALATAAAGARAAGVVLLPKAAVGKMQLLDAVELGLGAFGVGMTTGCTAETVRAAAAGPARAARPRPARTAAAAPPARPALTPAARVAPRLRSSPSSLPSS
jgi:hypothetical protein